MVIDLQKQKGYCSSKLAIIEHLVVYFTSMPSLLIFFQDREKQNWEAACQSLRTKLEASENTCLRSEIELAKMRSMFHLTLFKKF